MIENKYIELDGVIIPYIINENKEIYYPLKYIFQRYLLKSNISSKRREEYKEYIHKYIVDWSFTGTVPQEGSCIRQDGLIKLLISLEKTTIKKDKNKLKRFNLLCKYLHIESNIITNNEPVYDDYTLDCINYIKEISPNVKFKKCPVCNRNLPNTLGFYIKNNKYSDGKYYKCKSCTGNTYNMRYDHFNDTYYQQIYNLFGNDGYLLCKNDELEFYKKYVHNNKEFTCFKPKSKDFLKNIIKYFYDNKIILDENMNIEYILNFINIKGLYKKKIKINELYEYTTNEDCKVRPWLYSNYKLGIITNKEANQIINLYIKENNIIIDDIFNYNYSSILKKCKLTQFLDDIKSFIVNFYDYKYAGYKFKIHGVNYYKNKDNRIFDMKWLIEKDLKLQIEKIPLYITKNFLNEQYSWAYHILNKSYYNGNLFKWIDECYPNKFIEQDFHINKYRIEFDSMEEAQIDRVLRENINNVIYNIRNSKNEVSFEGYKPDWIIFTSKGTYLVEYFGMYMVNCGDEYKSRLSKYKHKTELKFKVYEKLLSKGYKHLYIFKDDMNNNFEGLIHKLDKIK